MASVVVGLCVVGVEGDGTIVIGNSAVIITLAVFGNAPAVISHRKVRFEDDGAVVISDSAVIITLASFGGATGDVGL